MSTEKSPIVVDQTLIKILVKTQETTTKPIRIMNVGKTDSTIKLKLSESLSDIVNLSESSFDLKAGQTKTVQLSFRTKLGSIEYSPDVYVGKLLVEFDSATETIPVIVEIESFNVLFDTNLNIQQGHRRVLPGNYTLVEVKLFNLMSREPTSVMMGYSIKDLNGNTIITEAETVVVTTQTTFTKSFHISETMTPGTYVFTASSEYGSSVGTSSYVFEVVTTLEQGTDIVALCLSNSMCLMGLFALIIIIATLTISLHFVAKMKVAVVRPEIVRKPVMAVKKRPVIIEKPSFFKTWKRRREKRIKERKKRIELKKRKKNARKRAKELERRRKRGVKLRKKRGKELRKKKPRRRKKPGFFAIQKMKRKKKIAELKRKRKLEKMRKLERLRKALEEKKGKKERLKKRKLEKEDKKRRELEKKGSGKRRRKSAELERKIKEERQGREKEKKKRELEKKKELDKIRMEKEEVMKKKLKELETKRKEVAMKKEEKRKELLKEKKKREKERRRIELKRRKKLTKEFERKKERRLEEEKRKLERVEEELEKKRREKTKKKERAKLKRKFVRTFGGKPKITKKEVRTVIKLENKIKDIGKKKEEIERNIKRISKSKIKF